MRDERGEFLSISEKAQRVESKADIQRVGGVDKKLDSTPYTAKTVKRCDF